MGSLPMTGGACPPPQPPLPEMPTAACGSVQASQARAKTEAEAAVSQQVGSPLPFPAPPLLVPHRPYVATPESDHSLLEGRMHCLFGCRLCGAGISAGGESDGCSGS